MTTPTERYDMLLGKIEELQTEVEVARQALHMEQESHRHTREDYEAYAQSVGMIVVERDTAEERLKEVRQELETIDPDTLDKEAGRKVRELTEKVREPLPRHQNTKDDTRRTMVDRDKQRA